jgi:rod shape-determining protein MreD
MIIEIVAWIAVVCGCFALQTTLMPVMAIVGVQPDLLMVALLILSFQYGSVTAVWAGFFIGLCQDIYSPSVLGQNALAKAFAGFFMSLFNEHLMSTDPSIKLAVLGVAFILHDSIFMAVELFRHGTTAGALFLSLLTATLPRMLYSALFAAAYYFWDYYARPSRLKR